MITIKINDKDTQVAPGQTILQAAQKNKQEIPIFCYHSYLNVAGNCRMCLVEIKGQSKLAASCAMPVADGMEVYTNNEKVKEARKSNLEFLLINHPLDCPICDQGGECDLQDISMMYGHGINKNALDKRAVQDKYMGPIIKTFMNRCIHCTRCIRFSDEVSGDQELGTVARGYNLEITTYLDNAIKSELSGNLADICPVGALTARPYAYQNRSWELKKIKSIDVLDALGSNITIHTQDNIVKRIMPCENKDINEVWLSDKARYSCDGLRVQRLDKPYLRINNKLEECSWSQALKVASQKLTKNSAVIFGDLTDCETYFATKLLMNNLGSNNLASTTAIPKEFSQLRSHYLFNITIAKMALADVCLIIGANIRADATLLQARMNKQFLNSTCKFAYLGGELNPNRDFNFDYQYLGNDLSTLIQILDGQHKINAMIEQAQRPMLILGYDGLSAENSKAVMSHCINIADKYNFVQKNWLGYNIVHPHAGNVGSLDLQCNQFTISQIMTKCQQKEIDTLYLHNMDDNINFTQLADVFIIYQGHHGDKGAQFADLILPSTAYTEKNASYINIEGRLQQTNAAVSPLAKVKEDWLIVYEITQLIQNNIPYEDINSLRCLMESKYPSIFNFNNADKVNMWAKTNLYPFTMNTKLSPTKFNFYMRDIISRNSATMAKCEQELNI